MVAREQASDLETPCLFPGLFRNRDIQASSVAECSSGAPLSAKLSGADRRREMAIDVNCPITAAKQTQLGGSSGSQRNSLTHAPKRALHDRRGKKPTLSKLGDRSHYIYGIAPPSFRPTDGLFT